MTKEEAKKMGATHYSFKYGYIKRSFRHWLIWNGRQFTYFYMPVDDYSKL